VFLITAIISRPQIVLWAEGIPQFFTMRAFNALPALQAAAQALGRIRELRGFGRGALLPAEKAARCKDGRTQPVWAPASPFRNRRPLQKPPGAATSQPDYRLSFAALRYAPGVAPVNARNISPSRRTDAKPEEAATSSSERCVFLISRAASSTRSAFRYALGDLPSSF